MEASEALDIFHSADGFPGPVKTIIQDGVRDYLTSVYVDEVQRMSQGDISLHSGGAHTKLAKLFYQIDEGSIPNRELYAQSLHCLNNLAQYRRLRIFAGNDTVPPVIWLVLLVGGVFTVSYTYFFGMKNIRAQYMITSTLTVTITLILFLIYVLDHPFTGTSKVSLEPFRQVIEIMRKG
jgi:Protein of unknown function (DUF4239)